MADENWAWGVDLRADRIDIASLPLTGRKGPKHFTLNVPSVGWNGAERLHGIMVLVEANARFWARSFPPLLVGVEIPWHGRGVHPTLGPIGTAVQVGLFAATRAVVHDFPPPTWKKELGIGGGAKKADVIAWCGRILNVHTDDDNIADAMAIAEVMRQRCP